MTLQVVASDATKAASGTGAAVSVVTPALTCQAGDLLILNLSFWSPPAPLSYVTAADVTVPGYTFRDRTDGSGGGVGANGFNSMVFTRTASIGDEGSTAVTVAVAHPCYGIGAVAYVVRGQDIDPNTLIINTSQSGDDANVPIPGVVWAGTADVLLIEFADQTNGTVSAWTPPAGYSRAGGLAAGYTDATSARTSASAYRIIAGANSEPPQTFVFTGGTSTHYLGKIVGVRAESHAHIPSCEPGRDARDLRKGPQHPYYGILVERYTGQPVLEVNVNSWSRHWSDTSDASAATTTPTDIGLIEPWRHWLQIYEGGSLQWKGPVFAVDWTSDGNATFTAKDPSAYFERRIMGGHGDGAARLDQLLNDYASNADVRNLFAAFNINQIDVTAGRLVDPVSESFADALRILVTLGAEWRVVADTFTAVDTFAGGFVAGIDFNVGAWTLTSGHEYYTRVSGKYGDGSAYTLGSRLEAIYGRLDLRVDAANEVLMQQIAQETFKVVTVPPRAASLTVALKDWSTDILPGDLVTGGADTLEERAYRVLSYTVTQETATIELGDVWKSIANTPEFLPTRIYVVN